MLHLRIVDLKELEFVWNVPFVFLSLHSFCSTHVPFTEKGQRVQKNAQWPYPTHFIVTSFYYYTIIFRFKIVVLKIWIGTWALSAHPPVMMWEGGCYWNRQTFTYFLIIFIYYFQYAEGYPILYNFLIAQIVYTYQHCQKTSEKY